MIPLKIYHFRRFPYEEMLEKQQHEFRKRVECRKEGREMPDDLIFIVEHLPVYTLGKHGDPANLTVPEAVLKQLDIELHRIERGGDITYHGPGQLTVYPIIDMTRYKLGVKSYINLLEEAVIQTVKEYGIEGKRIEGATGVWIKDEKGERKISAIGVKCSRFVTMHGLALNVGRDLSGFMRINPCGFIDKGVTSIEVETGRNIDLEEVAGVLSNHLTRLLRLHIPSQENS